MIRAGHGPILLWKSEAGGGGQLCIYREIFYIKQRFFTSAIDLESVLTLSCRPLTKKLCDRRKLVNLLVESARQKSHTVHLRFLNQY